MEIPAVLAHTDEHFEQDIITTYYDMFTDEQVQKYGGAYASDPELFGMFRLKVLLGCKRTERQEKMWKEILKDMCKDRDVEYVGEDMERTVDNIVGTIPEVWINESMEYLNRKGGDFITRYTSEEGFMVLKALRETPNVRSQLMDAVNDVILSCPETKEEMVVIRGIYCDNDMKVGEEVVCRTPNSASFGSINCEKHVGGKNGSMMKITIPKGKRLAYHESEDQKRNFVPRWLLNNFVVLLPNNISKRYKVSG